MQEEDLKQSVRRRLGERYTEDVWALLEHDGYVSEVVELGAEPETLYERAALLFNYLQPRRTRSPSAPGEAPSPRSAGERAAVLSNLVADVARQDPDVVRFRANHLGGKIKPWTDLAEWIEKQSKLVPETVDVTIAIRKDDFSNPPRHASDLASVAPRARITQWKANVLAYAIPGDQWVHKIAVNRDSALDSLRILSDSLSKSYGWQPAQATVFVVTDTVAYIDPIRAIGPSEQIRNRIDMGWTRRITLDIDPTLTPDEVAAAYQRVRKANGLSRLRQMSPKHLQLASFTGADHPEISWQERFDLWNRLHPAWKYSAASNFRRDAIRAQYRVLYPGRHRGSTPIRDSV